MGSRKDFTLFVIAVRLTGQWENVIWSSEVVKGSAFHYGKVTLVAVEGVA